MKKIVYSFLISIFSINVTLLFANNVDTGWMTFTQPNGIEFTGRGWGDEFEFYWETKDGYRFVKNFDSGYWCYAVLSQEGDFKASNHAVGIVNPESVGIERQLKFSEDYLAEIEKRRAEFEAELQKIRDEIDQWKKSRIITATRTVWVDLILVEFNDVRHDPSYTFDDFNRMFASEGEYEDPYPPTPHPDDKPVFGSVHEYWDNMTNGDVDITGAVWNTSGWITLDSSKSYYHDNSESILLTEIDTTSGYDTSVLGANHLRAVLYAGNEYLEHKTLHPHAIDYGYLMAAEFSRPQNQENDWNFFANIGTHCHELGHAAFGLPDRYGTWTYNQWGLMAVGNKNGPDNELACPASLNPYDREANGWITFQNFSGTEANKTFVYNYASPQLFKIAESGNEFFLIENRQNRFGEGQGFDRWLPYQGILVWHKFYYYSDELDLIEADNNQSSSTQTGDPFPGSTDNRHLNDFTTPNIKYYNGSNSQIVMHRVSDVAATMHADLGDKWFGEVPLNLTWENDVEFGGDVTVPNGIVLTIAPSVIANLNGKALKSTGGTINRDYSSDFNPDIRLVNGSTLKGQYSTLADACADAQSADQIQIWDNIHVDGGFLMVPCDIIIEQWHTLYLHEGTTLEFVDGKKLSVDNGTLETDGTNSARVLLTSAGIWGGVWSTIGTVDMSYTNINYATYGLHLGNYVTAEISNCQIKYNNTGVYLWYSDDVDIMDSQINTNNYDGIWGQVTAFNMNNSSASSNYNEGIDIKDCEPTLRYSSFTNNKWEGIEAKYDVIDMGADCDGDQGYNQIYNNKGYEVYLSHSDAFAHGNWWGTPEVPWNDILLSGGSHLYEDCPLSSPPSFAQMSATNSSDIGCVEKMAIADSVKLIFEASELINEGRYAEAADMLRPLVESKTVESHWRVVALRLLYKAYAWAELKQNGTSPTGDFLSYLATIADENAPGKKGADDDLYRWSQNLTIRQQLRRQNIDAAIETCDLLIARYPDSPTEELRLYDLFNLYLFKNQLEKAKATLATLAKKYPKSDLLEHADHLLNDGAGTGYRFDKQQPPVATESESTSYLFFLLPNYPNPFNPETTIEYQLADESEVTIKIYNLLGHEVKTLINKNQPAGSYRILWDGRDDWGQPVTSGVYIYKIVAGDFVQGKKMILLR